MRENPTITVSKQIERTLNRAAELYECPEFIENDPISIPHRFTKKQDIEIAAFFASIIAWGNRKAILKSGEKLLDIFEGSPSDFITKASEKDFSRIRTFYHRTFNGEDAFALASALRSLYKDAGLTSLEGLFKKEGKDEALSVRMQRFRERLCAHLPERTHKHIGNMQAGSAAKKLNLFLRWMVRPSKRGVDFGIWKTILPQELYVPLDVHSARVSRQLGILERNANDAKAVYEVSSVLKSLCPEDPVKYDFALFGIGVYAKEHTSI
ncbi:MAG: TIGR02757 family protein [Spirochaetaceae bacterium]|nr:TIGR02757 family protein [Spirochaetaceae bacterium]